MQKAKNLLDGLEKNWEDFGGFRAMPSVLRGKFQRRERVGDLSARPRNLFDEQADLRQKSAVRYSAKVAANQRIGKPRPIGATACGWGKY